MRASPIAILFGVVLAAGSASAQTEPAPSAAEAVFLLPTVETACDGAPIQPEHAEEIGPDAVLDADAAERADTVLAFSIDADGRTRDIGPAPGASPWSPSAAEAVQAGLAAWRFPTGARKDCRLTIRYRARPMAEVETGDLLRYFAVTRTTGPVRDAVADRLAGPDASCGGEKRGGRAPRTVSYPDFHIGRRPPPGGRTWTVLRWNIAADGRATDVETLGSSGDAELDAETRRAVSETVVAPGRPLKGCVYNFYRNGPILPAPPVPEPADDPLANCPDVVADRFRAPSDLPYPTAFRERSVEGWALVRFDTATWGQVGNVQVVEAQPAAAFAAAARRLVAGGAATPSFEAGVRCIVPVRYRMPVEGDDPAEAG